MSHYMDEQGIVQRWPRKEADRTIVAEYLTSFFETNRVYAESEVNEILRSRHSFQDWALLRRELFERGHFQRDARRGLYWRK